MHDFPSARRGEFPSRRGKQRFDDGPTTAKRVRGRRSLPPIEVFGRKYLFPTIYLEGSEPFGDGGNVEGGFVADGELVVPGGEGTVAFEPVEPHSTASRCL